MDLDALFANPMERGEGFRSHGTARRSYKRYSHKAKSGNKEAAAKLKAKAISIRRPSKAQERAEQQLQKALEKQVEKGVKATEKWKHLSRKRISGLEPVQALPS